MNFVVTARKWRPGIFEDVVGQEHITKTLKNAIVNNRIAHAYIFAGPRGVGKTTTARILAKSLNCLNPKDGEPCNECEMCKSFMASQSLDIIEIDGASNRRIEEIRTLRESVKYAPSKGKYKIYIIDEVHMLTNESFNALLKTLEEPPEHTIFVFATTDVHKVPLTIISRCQRFDFRRIDLTTIKNQLKSIAKSEGIKIDDQSLTLISKKADGALRDAESLFDQVISFCGNDIKSEDVFQMLNLINEEIYFDISNAIISKNFKAAFDTAQQIYENGWNFIDFMNGLVEHFRNILTVVITKEHKLIESAEIFKKNYLEYKDQFTEGDLLRILTFLNRSLYELKATQNQKLKVEISLSHLIGLERSSTISELLSKFEHGAHPTPSLPNDNRQEPSLKFDSGEKKSPVINQTIQEHAKTAQNVHNPLPEPKKTTIEQTNTSNNSHNDAANRWSSFLEFISADLLIGPLLENSFPTGITNNHINIAIQHPEDIQLLNNSEESVNKLVKEFFNKPVKLNFIKQENTSIAEGNSPWNGNGEVHEEAAQNPENSELVKAIIEHLGGREI